MRGLIPMFAVVPRLMKECNFARSCFRTLPAKYVEKIADQMRTHNINALLIVGGFEVRATNQVVPARS